MLLALANRPRRLNLLLFRVGCLQALAGTIRRLCVTILAEHICAAHSALHFNSPAIRQSDKA
jgi:hypothetical protein